MLLSQRVAGATDALHNQGHDKQGDSWQLSQREDGVLMFIRALFGFF